MELPNQHPISFGAFRNRWATLFCRRCWYYASGFVKMKWPTGFRHRCHSWGAWETGFSPARDCSARWYRHDGRDIGTVVFTTSGTQDFPSGFCWRKQSVVTRKILLKGLRQTLKRWKKRLLRVITRIISWNSPSSERLRMQFILNNNWLSIQEVLKIRIRSKNIRPQGRGVLNEACSFFCNAFQNSLWENSLIK